MRIKRWDNPARNTISSRIQHGGRRRRQPPKSQTPDRAAEAGRSPAGWVGSGARRNLVRLPWVAHGARTLRRFPSAGNWAETLKPHLAAPREGEPSRFAWLEMRANPLLSPRFESEANPPLSPGSGAGRDRRLRRLFGIASGQPARNSLEGGSQAGSEDPAGALTEVRFGAIPSASPGRGIAIGAEALQVLPGKLPSPPVRPLARPSGRRVPPPSPQPSESVTILGSDGLVSVGGGLRRSGRHRSGPLRPRPTILTDRRVGQADSACGKRG
jgi:hypothetical protein